MGHGEVRAVTCVSRSGRTAGRAHQARWDEAVLVGGNVQGGTEPSRRAFALRLAGAGEVAELPELLDLFLPVVAADGSGNLITF